MVMNKNKYSIMMNQQLFNKLNELFDVTATQGEMDEILNLFDVVGQSEQLLGFGKYLQKWSNTFLSEEHLKQEIENYLKDK